MKRNLNESSTRSTAGCLPVPLFNQKKRTRQPLTSNPLKHDPGISTTSDSYDFPPLPTGISSLKQLAVVVDPGNPPGLKFIDFLLILEEGMDNWAWEAVNPDLPPSTTMMNTGQIPHSVSHPLRSQDSVFKSTQLNTDGNKSGWSYRDGNKNTSLKTWYRNDFRPQCKRTNLVANDGINSHPMNLGVQQQKQLRVSQSPNLSHQRQSEVLRQTHSSKTSGSTIRGLDKDSASQSFMSIFQQNQFKKKKLDDIPEENSLKNASLYQLKFKVKENSLRIISAVIESMKYWREHAPKTVLLFEILAVLDSAVTPGPYYSKTFLMRDGKNTLPCIFYEIDRELPRLIRGRVYRCVGNYDQKKNIFKCVSVRPASVSEQKTFQAFVKIVDTEMKYYTNVMNEM